MLNERKMKGWLTACLQGDMSLWLHSMRTGLMLVFILLMNFMLVRSNATMIGMYGYKVHLGETLFTCLNYDERRISCHDFRNTKASGVSKICVDSPFERKMAALPDCILHRHCSVFPAVYDSNVRIVFAVLCDSRKRMERFGKIGRKRRLHLRDADYSTIHSRSFTVSSVLLGVVCAVLLLFDNDPSDIVFFSF